jgi:hypothetical protein
LSIKIKTLNTLFKIVQKKLIKEMSLDCHICLATFDNNDYNNIDIVEIECCRQKLHKDCFLMWIAYKGINVKCPICRSEIISNENIKRIVTAEDIEWFIHHRDIEHDHMTDNLNEILTQVYSVQKKDNTLTTCNLIILCLIILCSLIVIYIVFANVISMIITNATK